MDGLLIMGCCCDSCELTVVIGEKRRVTLWVWIEGDDMPVLSEPMWTLSNDGETESSGTCEMTSEDGRWRLVAVVEPQKLGWYALTVSVLLGDERIIRNATVHVVERQSC